MLGYCLGMMFQLSDDFLDLMDGEGQLQKALGQDLYNVHRRLHLRSNVPALVAISIRFRRTRRSRWRPRRVRRNRMDVAARAGALERRCRPQDVGARWSGSASWSGATGANLLA